MAERYHLVLLGWSLSAGVLGAATDLRRAPAPKGWSLHIVAVLGTVGAVLGSAAGGWHRSAPWLLLAAACAAVPDRDDPPHPLGRWTLLMAVISLLGVWSAVPDTQAPLALAAVWAPLGGLWGLRGRATGPVATMALLTGIAGAAWVGSAGWGAALASVVAVGMLLAAPLALRGGEEVREGRRVVLVAMHVLVALLLPRVLMDRSVAVAAGSAMLTLVVCVAAARAVGNPSGAVEARLRHECP